MLLLTVVGRKAVCQLSTNTISKFDVHKFGFDIL